MQAAHQRKVVPEGDSWWTKTPVESSGITAAPRVPPKCSSEKQMAKRASNCENEAPTRKKRYRPIPRKRKERGGAHGAHIHPPPLLDEALNTSKIENPAGVISGPTTHTIPRRPSGIQQSIISRLPLDWSNASMYMASSLGVIGNSKWQSHTEILWPTRWDCHLELISASWRQGGLV